MNEAVRKVSLIESIALVSLIGMLVAIAFSIFTVVNDNLHHRPKSVKSYAGWAAVSIMPFAATLCCCVLISRRKPDVANSENRDKDDVRPRR
jgi:hypothetical protein